MASIAQLKKRIADASEALLSEEENLLRGAFERAGWSLRGAAELLDMAPSSLQAMLSRHPTFEEERTANKPKGGGRPPKPVPTKRALRDALRTNEWLVEKTATALGTVPCTLRKWIRATGLDAEHERLGPSAAMKQAWARKQAA